MDIEKLEFVVDADKAVESLERLRAAIASVDEALKNLNGQHGGISIQVLGSLATCDIAPPK